MYIFNSIITFPVNLQTKKFKRKLLVVDFYKKNLTIILKMEKNFSKHHSFSDKMFIRKEKSIKSLTQNGTSVPVKKERYSSLHNHSDLSLLDGASRISEMVSFTKKLGINSISITDHGVMHAIVDLFKECEKIGIKPIAGNEMYVINGNISRNYKRSQLSKYHQIVLALSEHGYKNLVKLTTLSHLNGWQGSGAFGRPCISKGLLFKYKKDIIITSACLGGEICQNLLDKNLTYAKKVANWYKNNFEAFFFLELQDHGHREDRAVNMNILKISEESRIKLISTNDSHFTMDRDVEAHDTLLCIQTGKPFDEPGRMRYSGTEFLKSSIEMKNMYRDHVTSNKIHSALKSTINVSQKAKNYSIWAEITIPKFQMPQQYKNFTLDEFLGFLGFQGLTKILLEKFENNIDIPQINSNPKMPIIKIKYKKYYERLAYELQSIKSMGFSTYFLVVWDFIYFARNNNVPIGSGRGSVAGSLVAYSLGITSIDPIENGLLFERFLNPARKSMPDIDTDFSIDGRDMIIEYVSMRYGQEKVAQIITFNRLTSKSILKDMGRSARRENPLIEKMSDLIPISRGKPLNLESMISKESPVQDFRKIYLKNEDLKNIIDKAINFEGMNKTTAVHAAGIVISSRKLDEVVPLTRGTRGEVMTQYPMEDVEYLGLLKIDFLGLKNLSMVESVINFVNYRFNNQILTLDSSCLQPHFDINTFNLLTRKDLDGIFQLDASKGMRDIVSEMRPSSIQDISSILALYRPGPLDTGLIPRFIKRKRKVLLYKFDYPELKQTLVETYGILIYQEQIMKVAQELGGYSMSQADILRRAMGKKKISEMRTQEKIFIEGCINNSLEKVAGRQIFNQMLGFAEYCFNKSHSTAYAFTTYQTAWLKSHWPVEFFSSLMSVNLTDFEKIEKYMHQAASVGIFVRKPEINDCDVFFFPDYSKNNENFVNFGLGSIKSVGEIAASIIITDRKIFGGFNNLSEVVNRLIKKQWVSKKLIETLIVCGCLDKIGGEKKRKRILLSLDKIIEWMNRTQKIKYIHQPLLLDLNSLKKENQNLINPPKPLVIEINSEQIYLANNLTGIVGINSFLLNQTEPIMLLGAIYSISFGLIEPDDYDLPYIVKNRDSIQKLSSALAKIEKIKIIKNNRDIHDFLIIAYILEIQEYTTFSKKKVLKVIFEDLNGIATTLMFEKTTDKLSTNKQMKNGDLIKIKNNFFPGDLFLGSALNDEQIFGSRKLKLSWMAPINGYQIILITVSAQKMNCFSVHLLLRLNLIINSYFSNYNYDLVHLVININGENRGEMITTNLSILESDSNIILKLFQKLGFECSLFKLNPL